ncbi:unnamed protein product [Lactuca saligna]|uniref:Uncharacterized protein n=1 Tax=Lactuca saligna TaxID=75948 RepID=A0AA36E2E3_LACSI|nr:unnamed protein product [Lactuca saligna]
MTRKKHEAARGPATSDQLQAKEGSSGGRRGRRNEGVASSDNFRAGEVSRGFARPEKGRCASGSDGADEKEKVEKASVSVVIDEQDGEGRPPSDDCRQESIGVFGFDDSQEMNKEEINVLLFHLIGVFQF